MLEHPSQFLHHRLTRDKLWFPFPAVISTKLEEVELRSGPLIGFVSVDEEPHLRLTAVGHCSLADTWQDIKSS